MTRARERLLLSGAVDFGAGRARARRAADQLAGPGAAPSSRSRCGGGRVGDLRRGADRGDSEVRVPCRRRRRRRRCPALEAASTRARARARRRRRSRSRRGRACRRRRAPGGLSARPAAARAQTPVDSLSYTSLTRAGALRLSLLPRTGVGACQSDRAASGRGGGGLRRARAACSCIGCSSRTTSHAGRADRGAGVSSAAGELGDRVRAPSERSARSSRRASRAGRAECDRARLARRAWRRASVRREHPFAFSLGPGEPLLSGVIDLLAREADGGALVLDYKSDRVRARRIWRRSSRATTARSACSMRWRCCAGAPRVEIVHWFLTPAATG